MPTDAIIRWIIRPCFECLFAHIENQVEQRGQEILAAQSPEFKAWHDSEKLADDRMMTLTDVKFDCFLKLPQRVIDSFGTMSDSEFQQWRE